MNPSKSELTKIKTVLEGLSTDLYPPLEALKLAKPVSCNQCFHFGFKGCTSIMEQMSITPAMAQLIATSTLATTATSIEQAAIKDGMVTILQDETKALNQVTTLEEVFTQVISNSLLGYLKTVSTRSFGLTEAQALLEVLMFQAS